MRPLYAAMLLALILTVWAVGSAFMAVNLSRGQIEFFLITLIVHFLLETCLILWMLKMGGSE